MIPKTAKIWMDGKLVDWDHANVHVLTHTLHYALGVFEGIRCYFTRQGPAIFRLDEHVQRLVNSARIFLMDIPYSQQELNEAIIKTVQANRMKECYIRPLVYIGYGAMGLYPKGNPVNVSIAVWSWGAYLGDEGLKNGIKVKTSSFIRNHVNANVTRGKVCGYYVNSQLAKKEAIACGYDEALLLDNAMNLPPVFVRNIQNAFGDRGRQWLVDLPVLIEYAREKWDLTNITAVDAKRPQLCADCRLDYLERQARQGDDDAQGTDADPDRR